MNHGSITRTPAETSTCVIHSAQTRSSGACRSTSSVSTGTGERMNAALIRARTPSPIGGSDRTAPPVISSVSNSYAESSDPFTPGRSPKVASTSSYA